MNEKKSKSESKSDSLAEIQVQPTLEEYFGEARPSPSAFFKVLRKSRVKRFRNADQEAAIRTLTAESPPADRLWALMSQSSIPEAVDAWIWRAAQSLLKERLAADFDPQDDDAGRIFEGVFNSLKRDLSAGQKDKRKGAETLFRIAICWLIEKRSLETWKIAERIQPVFFTDTKAASQATRRAVQKGRSGELRLTVATAALGGQMVKVAAVERDRHRDIASDLRHRVVDLKEKIEALDSSLKDAKATIKDHEATIAMRNQEYEADRLRWGHQLWETNATHKVLLGERLGPLLEDAIDALEIDPPAQGTALRRLKAALGAIEEVSK